jgi:hypothetical protein
LSLLKRSNQRRNQASTFRGIPFFTPVINLAN